MGKAWFAPKALHIRLTLLIYRTYENRTNTSRATLSTYLSVQIPNVLFKGFKVQVDGTQLQTILSHQSYIGTQESSRLVYMMQSLSCEVADGHGLETDKDSR